MLTLQHSVKSEINDLQRKANAQQEAHYRLRVLTLVTELTGNRVPGEEAAGVHAGQLARGAARPTKREDPQVHQGASCGTGEVPGKQLVVCQYAHAQAACTASLPDVDALSKHAFAVSQLTANCKDIDQAVTTKEERMKDLEDALQEGKSDA